MGKIGFIVVWLAVCIAWFGQGASQGMGDSRAYDQGGHQAMVTVPYIPDPLGEVMPGYLSPDISAWPESYQDRAMSPLGWKIDPADPGREGLVASGNQSQANQLYLQAGHQLLTEGASLLGEDCTLWARIGAKGSFQLYDHDRLLFGQLSLTPGWYRISGAYGSYLGQHLYRFQVGGLSSNDLMVTVIPGAYPTAFSLTGRILDGEGRGLGEARVVLINSDGGKFSTKTDGAGYYALDLASGIYTVNAQHPGYSFNSGQVQVVSGLVSAARPLVGTPQPGASLAGTGSLPPVFS